MAVKIKVNDQEYGLRLDLYAMEMIQDEFGSMQAMLEKLRVLDVKGTTALFRILANAELAYEEKEETVTGKELRHLRAAALAGIGKAIRAAIEEGTKSETTGGAEADDQVFDVYLAEIEEKN